MLAAAISAIMGVAVGALARNQVAAVVGTLLLLFVVTPLLQPSSETIFELTPFVAATAVAGDTSTEILSWGGAALCPGRLDAAADGRRDPPRTAARRGVTAS